MSYTNYFFGTDHRRNRLSEPTQLITSRNLFATTTSKKYMLGCIYELNDGRAFRYGYALTAIKKARMAGSLPPNANTVDIAQTAQASS